MVFSSITFLWVFLPITLLVYHVIPGQFIKARNLWLLVASLVFYMWGEPRYVAIMLASILLNYIAGLVVARASSWKKIILALTVLANLGILGYFKYFSTVFDLVHRLGLFESVSFAEVVLPIGISFYTFQALSYVVDTYRGINSPQKNILTLALYICLFPQLVAGPIVKYRNIEDQLNSRTCTLEDFSWGVKRFLYGLAKKVLIANQLALVVDEIYALSPNDVTTAFAWTAALFYMMQIYFDFSGYSDMAIGLGRMFGFKFDENFNIPYIATSIREFWRRWHISLSTWFREYVYIPLGGNRKGKARTYFNLLAVFVCTGVWHGAGPAFLLWGLYHGFFMIIERLGFGSSLQVGKKRILGHVYALLVVVLGWVIFRSASLGTALQMYHAMFVLDFSSAYGFFEIVGVRSVVAFAVAIVLCGPIQMIVSRFGGCEAKDFLVGESSDNPLVEVVTYIALLALFMACITSLSVGSYNPFIYFRF